MKSRVLIVETDPDALQSVASVFDDADKAITTADSLSQGLGELHQNEFDILITALPESCASAAPQDLHAGSLKTETNSGELAKHAAQTAAVLSWLAEVRRAAPHTPIVLVTRNAMEPVACEALMHGAASYVPLQQIQESLAETVEQALLASRHASEVDQCVTCLKMELSVPSEEGQVPSIIAKLEEAIQPLGLFDEMVWMQVAMALDEAILNAMIHGNLEVESALREIDDGQAYWDEIQSRREQPLYGNRRTNITLTATRTQVVFVIRDQGPGFDLESLPDPDDPSNLENIGGRGMMMIGAFMDEIHHNEKGNELTMIKRKAAGPREE